MKTLIILGKPWLAAEIAGEHENAFCTPRL
jgi:hypothetical protein